MSFWKSETMLKFLLFIFLSSQFSIASDKVTIDRMNLRFMAISTPTNKVRVVLLKPVEGLSLFSVTVTDGNKIYDFISRRAVEWDEAVYHATALRKFMKTHKKVQIIGNMASKDKNNPGEYFSLWELVRDGKDCVGYFGKCEEFEKRTLEWRKPDLPAIDPKIYP